MTMKKILAGVLAAASILSVSVFASADGVEAPESNKSVTKPGETEYEVGIAALKCELDVELPGQMKAFLNPYGASVAVNSGATVTKIKNGIVSWGYEVVNGTKEFGIFVDVKDLKGSIKGKNTPSLTDSAPAAGAKSAWVAMVGGKDVATAFGSATPLAAVIAKTGTDQTQKQACLPVKADGSADTQAKFLYCQAKDATITNNQPKGVIGFVGILGKSNNTTEVEWTDEDEITLSYVLKINPAPAAAVAADFT